LSEKSGRINCILPQEYPAGYEKINKMRSPVERWDACSKKNLRSQVVADAVKKLLVQQHFTYRSVKNAGLTHKAEGIPVHNSRLIERQCLGSATT
jgi:hypothetical protein